MVAEFSDPAYISYTKQVNAAGNLRLRVNATHNAYQYLVVDKAQIQVLRQNLNIGTDALGNIVTMPWVVDFYGLARDPDEQQLADGTDVATFDCPGVLSMLSWRYVMWAAGTASRSTFTSVKAETLMKLLVQYNITASATTAAGRKADGTMTSPCSITLQTDGLAGNTLGAWANAWNNLLEDLQKIAKVAGGDFDLVQTAPAVYEFRWYLQQRGTDRRTAPNSLTFSTKNGNMSEPRLQRTRSRVRTSAVVAGAGEGSLRATTNRTGNGFSSSNNIEMFVDARNLESGASLTAEGDSRLAENKLMERLSFNVRQQPSCYYGKHYNVGDLVNVAYKTYAATHKIIRVAVGWDTAGETVDIETEVWP